MTDDQSRPTDEQHQDAESETPKESRQAGGETASSETTGVAGGDSSSPDDADEKAADTDPSEVPETDRGTLEDATDEIASDAERSPTGDRSAESEADAEDASELESTGSETTAEADEATAETGDASEAVEADASEAPEDGSGASAPEPSVPEDVAKYERFKKMDGAQYDRVNEFLRERTYVTAREWAIARLCADFRTETGVEMTKIGENLPELVPFMTDTYTPQAVNQARSAFEEKVRQSGATFLYGAMSGFFTAEELDDMMYEVTEIAKFLLEVEGVDLSVDEELETEDRISEVMREVQSASADLRRDELECPECGHEMVAEADHDHDHDVEADD